MFDGVSQNGPVFDGFFISAPKMVPKTLFRKYFAKLNVAYKGQHEITLTDIRIMSHF